MKISQSILFTIIGVFIGAISVYAFTGSDSETNGTESTSSVMNHSEYGMNNEEQIKDNTKPTMPGQEAFGSIQEIMAILENDPNTDWSKVDIPALKRHLIDMNELTLYADVENKELVNGLEMKVTGSGRTINAIHRMVPTHVKMTLNNIKEWEVKLKELDNGVILTVTTQKTEEVDHIKGLGFIGIMATGANHPAHHLMMAKGEMH